MLKIKNILTHIGNKDPTMRDRFILRVLLPPFLLLLIIGGVGFWQLNKFLKDQAVDNLQSAAKVTAIRLEREIAIREVILKNTADEISVIKNKYSADINQLELNRSGCREYYLQKFTFTNSPDSVCEVFSQNLNGSRPSLALIEDSYVELAKTLQTTEFNNVNQRLSAFKSFFPETLALIALGKDSEIISAAVSGDNNIVSANNFKDYAVSALNNPLQGEIVSVGEFKLAIFAFPVKEGSVLAAYDVNNTGFIRPSWQATPINNNEVLSIITESEGGVIFPGIRNEQELLSATLNTEDSYRTKAKLEGVQNVIVAESVGDSNWTVLVASPEALLFAPVRDTQFIIIIIGGLFIIGFLWVGTFFIKKTTDNLAQLVTGAMVYGSGRLDYKLELKSSEKEFKQLADTMNYMAQRIAQGEKEIDERNKEFISIATHELRAPMTSIIGYLSMLDENIGSKLNKQNNMLLTSAYEGSIRLRNLVNDMLDAARLEGGREEFRLNKLHISKYITECVESMTVVAKQTNITVSYDDKVACDVYADEGKLRIILNNFVSNAIKYNHPKGRVEIKHIKHKDNVVTAITSTGPTIPADQQAHMFEKFFRVDTPEHKKVTGTGIGMYVTKQYIEAMNGKTWFTSNPGEDTVFYFSLPISGVNDVSNMPAATTPKRTNSKWIMRWRRRMR
jgi:signal transduction histidine kinase